MLVHLAHLTHSPGTIAPENVRNEGYGRLCSLSQWSRERYSSVISAILVGGRIALHLDPKRALAGFEIEDRASECEDWERGGGD